MRTPDGRDCSLYYEDFHRGRSVQECRAPQTERSAPWQPRNCAKCPVPAIQQANASPTLQLTIQIQNGFLGFGHRVTVTAFCRKHEIAVENPYTGCLQCNAERPGLNLFAQALDDNHD